MSEWSRPRVSETTGHRQASWIELFFDLVFIASLAESIHYVEAHLQDGLIGTIHWFLIMFTAPWIVWRSVTFYSDRYEENTSRHRVLIIVLMIPIGLFAYSVHGLTEGHFGWFWIAFLASRIWLLVMWGTVNMEHEAQRQTLKILIFGHGAAMLLVSIGFLTDFFIWFVTAALLIELFQTLLTLRSHTKLPALTQNHLPERFGLFTMLILGEGVLGVMYVLSGSSGFFLPIALFLLIVFCYWIYYDQVIYRLFQPTAWHIYWWGMWNWGIAISLLLLRSSFVGLKDGQQDAQLLFLCAVLLFLLTTGGTGLVGRKDALARRMTVRFIQARVILGLGLISAFLWIDSVYALITITLLVLLTVLLQGMYYWVKHLKRVQEV
ncbi:low temperature requirement protein A [Jeotgalibacillus aurantiacus]|uniref:low temperature requirement protein A n=1 Tax=Jeotgalibacillus aurantiacus TaxID=2763266 RepID=UPI001D0B36D9|nr:low temperature requirement protein A [Jeotgalibacillus aurantiacus]